MNLDQVAFVVQERGAAALAALERLCDEPSPQDDCRLGDAIGRLVQLRDQLIMARRAGARCGDELGRTNAILSSIFGLEFPIGDAQRTRLREARDGIKAMLRLQRQGGDPGG